MGKWYRSLLCFRVVSSNEIPIDFETKSIDDFQSQCVQCQTEPRNMALIPCGHAALCVSCAYGTAQCPNCHEKVQSLLRLH